MRKSIFILLFGICLISQTQAAFSDTELSDWEWELFVNGKLLSEGVPDRCTRARARFKQLGSKELKKYELSPQQLLQLGRRYGGKKEQLAILSLAQFHQNLRMGEQLLGALSKDSGNGQINAMLSYLELLDVLDTRVMSDHVNGMIDRKQYAISFLYINRVLRFDREARSRIHVEQLLKDFRSITESNTGIKLHRYISPWVLFALQGKNAWEQLP